MLFILFSIYLYDVILHMLYVSNSSLFLHITSLFCCKWTLLSSDFFAAFYWFLTSHVHFLTQTLFKNFIYACIFHFFLLIGFCLTRVVLMTRIPATGLCVPLWIALVVLWVVKFWFGAEEVACSCVTNQQDISVHKEMILCFLQSVNWKI